MDTLHISKRENLSPLIPSRQTSLHVCPVSKSQWPDMSLSQDTGLEVSHLFIWKKIFFRVPILGYTCLYSKSRKLIFLLGGSILLGNKYIMKQTYLKKQQQDKFRLWVPGQCFREWQGWAGNIGWCGWRSPLWKVIFEQTLGWGRFRVWNVFHEKIIKCEDFREGNLVCWENQKSEWDRLYKNIDVSPDSTPPHLSVFLLFEWLLWISSSPCLLVSVS